MSSRAALAMGVGDGRSTFHCWRVAPRGRSFSARPQLPDQPERSQHGRIVPWTEV